MRRFAQRHPRALAGAGAIAVLALAGVWLLLDTSLPGRPLVRASYGWLHALAPAPELTPADSAVVLVYLDDASYRAEHQNPAQPWDRALHAKLVRRLTQAGARAVVFDIIFSEPGGTAVGDREFADAIRANGRVILAAELNRSSRDTAAVEGVAAQALTLPYQPFLDAAAGWGLANVIIDDDFVVRRYFAGFDPQNQPSLTRRAAQFLNLPSAVAASQTRWLRYYGRALHLPHVSYTDALDPGGVTDEFFRGKIVFVGARPLTGGFTQRRDEFRSPFPSWQREMFMPAVEVHATQMLNLVRGDWLRRLPFGGEACVLIVAAGLLGWGLLRCRPLAAAGVALGAEVAVLGVALMAFAGARLWFPWLLIGVMQIPLALGGSVLFHSLEWYRTRRRLEALRREAEAKIRQQAALIDKAQDAILVQDLQGRFVYANPGAVRLYGWPAEEFTRDGVPEQLFAPCAGQLAEARRAVLERGEWQGELEQATRGGARLLVESRWTLLKDDAGQPKSVLFINTDITEKKRLEARFLRAQRLEAVWSIAGGMAHDLNNALSPVLMGIQRLRKRVQDEDTQRMLAVMEANTHRGADMVKQVLTFSQGRGDAKELLNPGQLLHEMGRVAAQTFPKSISVSTLAPRDLWPVLGNATQLHQVLLNLCVNARDAMPNGGELTLAGDNVDLGAEEAREIPGATPGRFVMLLVADTGSGIAPEVLPRLFEPFFTTKAPGKGTGLGLSTSAHIVRAHGGFVSVKSEPGVGTTFEIYLPRATATPAFAQPAAAPDLPHGHGELILLIDDELALREVVAATLTDHGYQVLAASNGAEALSLLARRHNDIRLVLTDLEMPEMDGLATLAAIRKEWKHLPVVLMSGVAQRVPALGDEAGASLLAKPFTEEQLLRALDKQFQGRVT